MLYEQLTGMENLAYFASLQGASLRANGEGHSALEQMAAAALVEVGLDAKNTRRVGEYSQGMRQRASLARVLLSEPDLLLLDEPFSNLDAASAQRMIERLLAYVAKPGSDGMARTLVLTTHQAELARPLAQTTITLQAGRVVSVAGGMDTQVAAL